MHIEFAHCTRRVLWQWIQRNPLRMDSGMLLRCFEQLGLPAVEDCPRAIRGTLTSNIAFQYTTLVKSESGVLLSPRTLELALLEDWNAVSERKGADPISFQELFCAYPSESGHFNVDVSTRFERSFLSHVCSLAPREMLTRHFLLAEWLQLEDDMPQTIESLDSSYVANWNSVLERATSCLVGSDIARLLASVEQGGQWGHAERAMLLSLLENPELEVGDFLSGMKSTQNVPWLLAKFALDSKAVCDKNRGPSGDISEVTDHEFWAPVDQPRLRGSLDALLRFRARWALGIELNRPEISFSAILIVIQRFYESYHHPRVRELIARSTSTNESAPAQSQALSEGSSTASSAPLLKLIAFSRELVCAALTEMELSPLISVPSPVRSQQKSSR